MKNAPRTEPNGTATLAAAAPSGCTPLAREHRRARCHPHRGPHAIDALVAASDGPCTAILRDNAPADSHHIREVLRRALDSDRNDL